MNEKTNYISEIKHLVDNYGLEGAWECIEVMPKNQHTLDLRYFYKNIFKLGNI